MGMITINSITNRWNTQYQAMGRSPAIERMHSLYVELMMHATELAAKLDMAEKENAKLKRGETAVPPSSTTTSEAAPQPVVNFWATSEGQIKLRQNFGLAKPDSSTLSAHRPTSTAETLDYHTPEAVAALKEKWGVK